MKTKFMAFTCVLGLSLVIIAGLSGCGDDKNENSSANAEGKFPVYEAEEFYQDQEFFDDATVNLKDLGIDVNNTEPEVGFEVNSVSGISRRELKIQRKAALEDFIYVCQIYIEKYLKNHYIVEASGRTILRKPSETLREKWSKTLVLAQDELARLN